MDSIDEMAQNLDHIQLEINELQVALRNDNAAKLLPLITKSGRMRGEVNNITVKQFRKYVGNAPNPTVIKNGKIPWYYALDQIASEKGYKSDEELKDAIENAKEKTDRLKLLQKEKKEIIRNIAERVAEGPAKDVIKTTGKAPVFPTNEETQKEITEIDNTEIRARRNPSFWQIEVDKKETPQDPDIKARVRYSKGARILVNAAIKDAYEEDKKRKITPVLKRKIIRIMPKVPKLK